MIKDIMDDCCIGYEPFTAEKFERNADLAEGISGQEPINTQFENTVQDYVNNPRSKNDK